MKFKGKLYCTVAVFIIHTSHMLYYYFRHGFVDIIEWILYPILLLTAFWLGKRYDLVNFLSERDVLTNLYNRRFVLQTFEKVASVIRRNNAKSFILSIDCNNFKHINDTYGHHTGDKVLREIGKLLNKKTRKSDIAARWGGDEFLLLGQYKNERGLNSLVDRLHNELEELSDRMGFPVSASIGYAVYPDDHTKFEGLMNVADERMYTIKMSQKKSIQNI